MRQLPIHPDLVAELWCHHWTPRPPRLPVFSPTQPGGMAAHPAEIGQLSLGPITDAHDLLRP